MESQQILGVGVNSLTMNDAVIACREFMAQDGFQYVVTPNPEIILKAQDSSLLEALNTSDLAIPDGVGVQMAGEFLFWPAATSSGWLIRWIVAMIQWKWLVIKTALGLQTFRVFPEKVSGSDLFPRLLEDLKGRSYRVFILGSSDEVIARTVQKLREKYPTHVFEAQSGGTISAAGIGEQDEVVIAKINAFRPDLLLVGFGAPKQELWLYRNKDRLLASLAIAGGGTIDFLSGAQVRAGTAWQGRFEWLWRLIHQPSRIGRIFNALVIFSLHIVAFKANMIQSSYGNHAK